MRTIVTLDVGGAEYDLAEASVEIADLINALQSAAADGATHVAVPSGNYRGAKWLRLGTEVDWV